jgi:hypothetical protein
VQLYSWYLVYQSSGRMPESSVSRTFIGLLVIELESRVRKITSQGRLPLARGDGAAYGNDYLTPDRIREDPHQPISSQLFVPPEEINDFAATGISRPEDIRDIFNTNFYFGPEADDRMTAVAFDTKLNHYGVRLNAILGSDIGHWDVPDMTQVMVEAYEMVEHGFITEDDFRDFTFGNVVEMHTGMNPDFFKGTVVEDDVEKFKVEHVGSATE